ncbi:MAG TPA: 2-dehydropantoate 2-reductase [Candidatus Sulfotelmatobacter sp.]|nr:2-dehydropantoate 2-reductase [Candidatus Sulfotelmatobacter sp.]
MGSGGVGGYFGGRLAAAGADVTFIARGTQLEALRDQGLRIQSELGDLTIAVTVCEEPREAGPVDLVILSVKLWDTEAAITAIAPLMTDRTAVMSLQNGVTKDDALRAAFGSERVVGALCYIGAAIAEPGVIRHTGKLQRLVVGEYGGRSSERVAAFAELCRRAAIDVEVSTDIERAVWEKFVFLVGFSGATSVIRQPIGPIRGNAGARTFLAALFAETATVGRAGGVQLPDDFAENRLAFCDTLHPAFTSSMHGDLERGGRLEVPWLHGVVSDLGSRAGIPTPANDFVRNVLSVYVDGPPVVGP